MICKRLSAILVLSLMVLPLFAQDKPDALVLYRQGKYDEAVTVCREELSVTPRNMNSYSVLCWSLVAAGRYAEARDAALEAQRISRWDGRIIEVLGEAYYYLGDNLKALQQFEEYASIAENGDRIGRVYYLMGEIFIRLKEYHHADIALSTAVYHIPNVAAWWSRLGYAREMAEDYEYAVSAYDKALVLKPGFSEAKRGRDRVASRSGA